MSGNTRRVRLDLEYFGKRYCGWQYQDNGVSIQQKVEEAIVKITGERGRVTASGRTDAGVHAINQVAHVDLETDIIDHDLANALNSILPRDIGIIAASTVSDDWHARFSARTKTYRYLVLNQRLNSVFHHERTWHVKRTLNMENMRNAADILMGEHDFSSFQSTGRPVKDAVRNLSRLLIINEPPLVIFEVTSNGFLKQMVRNIVGTLVDVSSGRFKPDWMVKVLQEKDRKLAGQCAPAEGLSLLRVDY